MSTLREDRWSTLGDPEAVEDAAERLRQIGATASEQCAVQRWIGLLAPQDGERILDVGAGLGEVSMQIAKHVHPDGVVHAIDLSPGLVAHVEERSRQLGLNAVVRTGVGDARALPFGDAAFDAAFCRWLLLHLSDPERVIAEMCRVVRPRGRLLCVEADWETLAVHPGDPEVTRAIADANVRRQVDGRAGRKLVPLLCAAGLWNVAVSPFVTLDLSGDWLPILESRLPVAADVGVPKHDLDTRWAAIVSAAGSGQYVMSFTQYGVTGTVPPGTING